MGSMRGLLIAAAQLGFVARRGLAQAPTCKAPKPAQELAALVDGHRLLSHRFLRRFAQGDYARMGLATAAFAVAQREYGSFFPMYVASTAAKLEGQDRATLFENYAEEQGFLSDADVETLTKAGVQEPARLRDVKHTELLARFVRAAHDAADAEAPGADHDEALAEVARVAQNFTRLALESFARAEPTVSVAVLGFAIEGTVSRLYQPIWDGLKLPDQRIAPNDYAYIPLHVVLDEGHASVLYDIFTNNAAGDAGDCAETATVQVAHKAVADFLEARAVVLDTIDAVVSKADAAVQPHNASSSSSSSSSSSLREAGRDAADLLYDKQASNWVRTKESSLSDFTARRRVMSELGEIPATARVLDLGCGEGFIARKLVKEAGARKVVGVDISKGMIDAAMAQEAREPLGITYGVADATTFSTSLGPELREAVNAAETGLVTFDLIVSIFLFNYVDLAATTKIMAQARAALAEGGTFLFTVPHPSLAFWQRDPEPPFYFETSDDLNYFEADSIHEGKIFKTDGTALNVRLFHKTFADIFDALAAAGFTTMPKVVELHATPEIVAENPRFFGPVDGVPLHVLFRVDV